MKEIEAIKMRHWLNNLKEYGFTSLSISQYTGINEKSIRNFHKNKDHNLNNKHHKRLYEWLSTTIRCLTLLANEINLPKDKYLQATKNTRITVRANHEYRNKLKEMSRTYNLAEGVLLSYMIDYFYEHLMEKTNER